MNKPGHPLRRLSEFGPDVLERLRDRLSVTTAEELIGLWNTVEEPLARILGGPEIAAHLVEAARSALTPEELERIESAQSSEYPFRTGHQAPPPGKKTYR